MRITHFISSPASGGAEVYVKDLCIQMSRKGHEVHILFLESAKECGRDLTFENSFLSELEAENVTYSFIGHSSRKNLILGCYRLRKHLSLFKPDVLHCHLYYAVIFSMFTFGVKVIYTHHNIVLNAPRLIYKILDLKVSVYVGICNVCSNLLADVSKNKILHIDNAVSDRRIKIIEKYPENSFLKVLMIGRFTEQKNYLFMMNVLKSLQELPFVLQIAGEGPEFDSVKEAVLSNKLEEKVEFLGNVSDIGNVISQSDIFAMCSSWEGLPISLIEATRSGLPTIVTNVGGCGEVAHSCINGFVIDNMNEDLYISKLRMLLTSFSLRKKLSSNARDLSSHYEIKYAVEKHLSLYKTLI